MEIVCIGGGHGLSQVLSALADSKHHLTAIVTTTDNGGSTGSLRESYNSIAYGDARRCALTLASDNNLMKQLGEVRFQGGTLDNHSLGNILLAGLDQLCENPSQAIYLFCQMLAIKHSILPMTNTPCDLVAFNQGKPVAKGEMNVDTLNQLPSCIQLSAEVSAAHCVVESILAADYIIIGPGSVLTSVLPPLLVNDIALALQKTTATRIFVENTQIESNAIAALDHLELLTWLTDMVGYKFFDLSLSSQALQTINQEMSICQGGNQHLHNTKCLAHALNQLMYSERDGDDTLSQAHSNTISWH